MSNGGGSDWLEAVFGAMGSQGAPETAMGVFSAMGPVGGGDDSLPPLPPGAVWVIPGTSYRMSIGGGYIGLFEFIPDPENPTGPKLGPYLTERYKGDEAGAGGAAVDPFAEEKLLETIRHHKESEAIARRQVALDTATSALDAYLEATSQVNQRRQLALRGLESAFSEARQLLPWLVDPGQEHFAGFEPGGTLATHAEKLGVPFTPIPIQHKQLIPGQLAQPIEEQPAGAPSSEVLQMINDILGP